MKITPAPGFARFGLLRSVGNFYTRATKYGLVAQKWPKGRQPNTDAQQFNKDQMKVAAYFATISVPVERESAENFSKRSNDTWKDIMFRGMFGTLFYVVAPDGTVGTPFNHRYYPPITPEGDDVPWTKIKEWVHSIDGNTNSIEAKNLEIYTELLVACINVPCTSSAFRTIQCSVDNGATYFSTLGNYRSIQNNGVEANQVAIFMSATQSTAALTAFTYIPFLNIGTKFICGMPFAGNTFAYRFDASDLIVNAIKVRPTAGNFSGGKVAVFAR